MGKLVLYLADGTTHQVILEKERITIGRRADNDLCLPHPAVSGEHATVTTILADSFLEDQGSTNGTLVNGRAIAKHFLRDRDVIDIGKQRIVYLADNDATVEPMTEAALHREIPGLTERVPRAEPKVRAARKGGNDGSVVAPGSSGPAARQSSAPAFPESAETSRYDDLLQGSEAPAPRLETSAGTAPMLAPEDLASVIAPPGGRARGEQGRRVSRTSPSASPVEAQSETKGESGWTVTVITGPNKGRVLAISKPEVVLGRVGVQIAAIRSHYGELRLVLVEGTRPIVLNGQEVPAEGAVLKPGDVFEVAGSRLEFAGK